MLSYLRSQSSVPLVNRRGGFPCYNLFVPHISEKDRSVNQNQEAMALEAFSRTEFLALLPLSELSQTFPRVKLRF